MVLNKVRPRSGTNILNVLVQPAIYPLDGSIAPPMANRDTASRLQCLID